MHPGRSSALARILAVAYTVLVVYASLHPFSGWRDSGLSLFAFLNAGWPRYYTGFDLLVNVLAYVPLGFFWMPVATAHAGRSIGTVFVCIALALLSGTLETLQNFLPSRVPSNVDLACNSLGALLGALAAQRWGSMLLSESRLLRWRHRHLAHEPVGDYGLTLLGIWLLVQLSPENLLFGSGNLRVLLELPGALPFDAERFSRHESWIAALGTLTIALMSSLVLRRPRYWHVLLLLALAILIRSFAAALLIEPARFAHWMTAGNLAGMGVGLVLAWPLLRLNESLRRVLAGAFVMATTALVNIAPDNPYLLQATQVWHQGHFLNFNGLTRVGSSFWPFFAMAFLMWRTGRERRYGHWEH
ncbi:MAG: VanZ family protein [Rhodocyclaceae bacterium]|jgi:VanZ family protein|nr:VanZ family protein [Rhodocyclaceae bacterium]